MTPHSARIKVVVAAGIPFPDAVKAAIPGSLADFAARHDFTASAVSMCIHGRQRHERVREALVNELSVDRDWLDEQLDAIAQKKGKAGDAGNAADEAAA